eukprot:CAMPEP_0179218732 /NCGR_PEP_ID=MMETSP0797-20121207/4630_1 /TAXON_ID=47934 /ORGANISM="Dinophysis acuminata, Strain DAEP01" /LENGTH=113 /DNA_ID=CAMNT_0020925099 /DNA_START=35 /DNA_END=376 /DNA_ORIENTATION=-
MQCIPDEMVGCVCTYLGIHELLSLPSASCRTYGVCSVHENTVWELQVAAIGPLLPDHILAKLKTSLAVPRSLIRVSTYFARHGLATMQHALQHAARNDHTTILDFLLRILWCI